MNGRYSIRREREAPAVPFGAAGVGALAALLGGLVGLAMPIGWLESLSFNLYLDAITASAAPPLGTTARLVAMLALAAIAGGLAFAVARLFDVESLPGGVGGLLDRLRGPDIDDEDDAPILRSADRHPDAPARRPFSAMRDIPDRSWDDDDAPVWNAEPAAPAPAYATGMDDDEELLLNMTAMPDEWPTPVAAGPADAGSLQAAPRLFADDPAADAMAHFDLVPPSLGDWETPVEPAPGDATAKEPVADALPPSSGTGVEPPGNADDIAAAPVARPRARRDTTPLDLSAGRLDELIARLEAGLSRKASVPVDFPPVPAMPEAVVDRPPVAAPVAAPATVAEDPAFPHDPALAAALATLRKMNLRSA